MLIGGRVTRGRQKLGDITNLEQQENRGKSMAKQEDPILVLSPKAKECSYLPVENTSLLGQVAERNQIIEYQKLELQKLRTTLQKLQIQNLHLAQANTQMLAELNMGKDKLKLLQHELACTVAALKVKNLNREEKITRPKTCDVARGESDLVPCIQQTRHPSSNHRSVSLTTELKVKGKKKDDNKRRRTKSKKSSKIKPQNCKAESPIPSDGTRNDILLVSSTNTNINADDAPFKSKIEKQAGKTFPSSAENRNRHKKRKLLAPSDGQEIRRSKRRESSDNQLHACEHVPAIKSNVLSNEVHQISLVSSGNTNLYSGLTKGEDQNVDRKTSSIDTESIKHPHKREVKGSSAGQEVPESKLTQSRNTKPDDCEPESLVSKLQSRNIRENAHLVKSASPDLNIFRIEPKQQDADASFHKHHAKKSRRTQKRKLSAPSQDQEIPRLTIMERPSRRATIGVIYKETPLNVKMRRGD